MDDVAYVQNTAIATGEFLSLHMPSFTACVFGGLLLLHVSRKSFAKCSLSNWKRKRK